MAVKGRDAEWLPNVGWTGDGTVPAISAIPIELDRRRGAWQPDTRRHLALPSSGVVAVTLAEFTGASLGAVRGDTSDRRGDTPGRPWLGLDVDELLPAGEPVPVRAVLHGSPPEPPSESPPTLSARLRAEGGPPGEAVPMVRDGDGWSVTLPAVDPGMYELEVRAVGVPLVDRLSCRDTVGVVAG